MWPNPQQTADLVTFTEEILNGKLYFFSSAPSHSVGYTLLSKDRQKSTNYICENS